MNTIYINTNIQIYHVHSLEHMYALHNKRTIMSRDHTFDAAPHLESVSRISIPDSSHKRQRAILEGPAISISPSSGGSSSAASAAGGIPTRMYTEIDSLFAQVEYDILSIERRIRLREDDRISASIARAYEMCQTVLPTIISTNTILTTAEKASYSTRLKFIQTSLKMIETQYSPEKLH